MPLQNKFKEDTLALHEQARIEAGVSRQFTCQLYAQASAEHVVRTESSYTSSSGSGSCARSAVMSLLRSALTEEPLVLATLEPLMLATLEPLALVGGELSENSTIIFH